MASELILPEYGRNIQNMVDIALKIEDRAERNRCARSIINCMGNLFPYLRDNDEFQHKLWDHLALMADFNLDIDYPYEITPEVKMHHVPDSIPLPKSEITELHYGRFVEQFIDRASNDEMIKSRNELILVIANYMKRCYQTYNQDLVNDEVIFSDIYRLSHGKIDVRGLGLRLQDNHFIRKSSNRNSGSTNKQGGKR